jgi:hypothetical protein
VRPDRPGERADDLSRRARLVEVKLRVLAGRFLDGPPESWRTAVTGPVAVATDGRQGVVLPGERGRRGLALGPALAWAAKAAIPGQLHVLVDDDRTRDTTDGTDTAGITARHATYFRDPPVVWRVVGAELAGVEAAPFPAPLEPAAADLLAAAPLREAGADVIVEHGIVTAELDGLEVGRVVGGVLELGVGKHDRAAAAMMETIRDPKDLLAGIVATVRRHRRTGAPPHLLNRLARERWQRSALVAEPSLIGAAQLRPVEPPIVRADLVEAMPAVAIGGRPDGTPLVVACSVGVDLDLVPLAADVRARDLPAADLVLVTPARDQYPSSRALAARLLHPAELVAHEGPWP